MRYTHIRKSPVVTLLSPSPALSRRAQEALASLFGVVPHPQSDIATDEDDVLDALFAVPFLRKQWDSVASKCEVSGTIIHFLSLQGSSVLNQTTESLSVLSILGTPEGSVAERIRSNRATLAAHISGRVTRIALKHSLGRSLTVHDLLGLGGGLPLLQTSLDSGQASRPTRSASDIGLREVALPHFDNSLYSDGRSLLSTLSDSPLHRPVVGLYQFQGGLTVRPLPAAEEDRILPAPSFVFNCPNLNELPPLEGARTAKIGYSGTSKRGQLMVAHASLPGLDFRLTDSLEFSSNFSEAQDALLAGSLMELQSENVLLEGGEGRHARTKHDAMDGVGDCWVEFRANVKQPWGFIKKIHPTTTKVTKVVKAPDLPYE